jgi:signal transduction histidine kinase
LDHESALSLSPAGRERSAHEAARLRALTVIAQGRIGNALLRFIASALAVLVCIAAFGAVAALYWLAGLALVVLIDRRAYQRLLALCQAGNAPNRMPLMLAWTAFQSAYGNGLAALLWFLPNPSSQTAAAIYLCGGLANAVVTLRHSKALSLAAITPSATYLVGLPVIEFALRGASDISYLVPLIGALLLFGWGAKLWQSVVASDAALLQADAAAMRERQAAADAATARAETRRLVQNELRTPMAALEGAIEHLRRAAASPQAKAHIAITAHAHEVLMAALGDLRVRDQATDADIEHNLAPADLRQLARGAVAAFRPAAQDKHLELFLDVSAQTPAEALIDAVRVRQILFNLLDNAVRYTRNGGVRVRLSAQPMTKADHARISFAVTDTGAGISRSHLALMFMPQDETQTQSSTGIAISLRLARLIGAQLTAQSELGEGSVFTLALDAPLTAQALESGVSAA